MRTPPAHRRQKPEASTTAVRLRALLLLVAAATGLVTAAGLLVVGWSALAGWPSGAAGSRRPDQLLGGLCAGISAALLVWVCCGVLLSVLAVGQGTLAAGAARWSTRLAPTFVRSAVAAAVGGSLAMATVSIGAPQPGASTTTTAVGVTIDAPAPTRPGPVAGWTPSPPPRPPTRPSGDVALVSASSARDHQLHEQVTVRRGDSLWSIAARQLGPRATALDVAREWPRWYAANRQLIGPDPDRLQPGQLLTPPRDPAAGDASTDGVPAAGSRP